MDNSAPRLIFVTVDETLYPMGWALTVMLAGLLLGCAQLEAQKEREALDATVAQAANDDEFCQSSGATPGTASYVDCRLNLSKQREATTPTAWR